MSDYEVYYSNNVFPVLVQVARKYKAHITKVVCRGGQILVDNVEVGEIRPLENDNYNFDEE